MNKIEIKILNYTSGEGMPRFLAKLTQRGQEIHSMEDLTGLFADEIFMTPSEALMSLPHTTLKRMNTMTIAITGLSTKAVSQLRTHAKRATFVSTSTQYSSYEDRTDNFYMPNIPYMSGVMRDAYIKIEQAYRELIEAGIDKDAAGYLLPQGLRKALIIHANMDDWQYIIQTRICRRNTEEVQYIARRIHHLVQQEMGEVWTTNMLPTCSKGKCPEGKFTCGKKLTKEEVEEV